MSAVLAPWSWSALPTIREGAKGPVVVKLRELLANHGITEPVSIADPNLFSRSLTDAVRAFQRAKNLGVDGIVGPKTWSKLFAQPGTAAAEPEPPASMAPPSSKDIEVRPGVVLEPAAAPTRFPWTFVGLGAALFGVVGLGFVFYKRQRSRPLGGLMRRLRR